MVETFAEALGKRKGVLYSFGIALLATGFFLLQYQSRFPAVLFWLFGLIFLGKTIQSVRNKLKGASQLTWKNILLDALLSLLLLNRVIIPVRLVALIVALDLFAIGVIVLIDCFLVYRTENKLFFRPLTEGLLHFLLGSFALFDLKQVTDLIYWVLGIYFMFLGLSRILDAYFLPQSEYSRRFRMGLPVILSAFIPVSALKQVNKWLSLKKSDQLVFTPAEKSEKPVDLEIWVHTARKGFEAMGHVDISYKGKTYAYGQYDPERSFLGGMIGDGVLFSLSSDDYLESLANDDWRAVFGYGISLTEEQKASIDHNLSTLFENTRPFHLATDKQKASYLGQISQRYAVDLFKFRRSKFKTYFVMTTNCVLLADTIMGDVASDIMASHGMLTPGVFQDYLETAYLNPKSNVVKKFILGKQEKEE
ncbi:hypothetical protein [Streptococcus hillyeri]|uniref:DUF308 domain-containing protein n=2 Tax=Streptococcus hillyeri TaxID=2282420 RepID=A0A3L9E2E8_9STRE|nr:hypothetical protein [Streptococcus hillyeri]RLY05320.1 hypothetical protein EAF07_01080 [Streptococcus hillyeri]